MVRLICQFRGTKHAPELSIPVQHSPSISQTGPGSVRSGDQSLETVEVQHFAVPCGEGFAAAIDDEPMVCVHSHDRREILQILEGACSVRGGRFDLDCVQ